MPIRYFRHKTAIVESDHIGDGTKIWHFAHIRENAKIGSNCIIGKDAYIDKNVEIGNNVKIQNFVSVFKGVKVCDDVFIGPSATFTNDLNPRAFIWDEKKIMPTVVERGASIGANSTIICGVAIGEYAMVGAGSVVTKSVPAFGLAYGNPAELRGFVCYCGKKLEVPYGKKEKEETYRCTCGKSVKIAIRE